MRTTNSLVSVAVALLSDADGEHWGYELGKRTGLRSGVLYPILRRLLEQDCSKTAGKTLQPRAVDHLAGTTG